MGKETKATMCWACEGLGYLWINYWKPTKGKHGEIVETAVWCRECQRPDKYGTWAIGRGAWYWRAYYRCAAFISKYRWPLGVGSISGVIALMVYLALAGGR